MKKYIIIAVMSLVTVFQTGCDDFLDVNHNIDSPDVIEDYLYLSGITQAYKDRYNDLWAAAPLAQYWSTSSYTTFANHYYTAGSDAGALLWRTVYWDQGMNLENMINQAIAAEHWTLAGMGLAMKAYSWDMLTKLHVELPMKQAFNNTQTLFDYDYQPEIYEQIRAWAKEGIGYLEMEDNTVYSNKITANDWIYQGDKAKWIKFAYGVIVHNLASLTNKSDFVTKYAPELIDAASKSFQSAADDAKVSVLGGGSQVPYDFYNNVWGTYLRYPSTTYRQSDYLVQVMTGTIPKYAEDGMRVDVPTPAEGEPTPFYLWELLEKQYVADTVKTIPGHYDPRVAVKLSTNDDKKHEYIDNPDSVKRYRYIGGSTPTTLTAPGSGASVPFVYGAYRSAGVKDETTTPPNDGKGRWIFRDDAPYILMTCAELKFCLAETYWKMGNKAMAYAAFREGVKADIDFTVSELYPATKGQETGGDMITKSVYDALAAEYLAGPYVEGLGESNLTLSHIMMQKYVALYPWGAIETWTDLRKYHYDIKYTGDYPSNGNGWDDTRQVDEKRDEDPTKVFKGFFLPTARDIEYRDGTTNIYNEGSPCYRLRPRYNSEYIWNIPSLEKLKPISGMAVNYHCSIPWFAYPGEYPSN